MRPPDLLWHGTTADFDEFDARHLGRMVRNPTTEFGFFFSEDREDAASWAFRSIEVGRAAGAPRILQVTLDLAAPVEISAAKFQFYLQKARVSTIQRDLHAWRAAGHDSMTTTRGGKRWWCAFDPARVRIIASELLDAPDASQDMPGF